MTPPLSVKILSIIFSREQAIDVSRVTYLASLNPEQVEKMEKWQRIFFPSLFI